MGSDNANYARVKRWRDKHRGLLNMRRRKAYARKKGGDASLTNAHVTPAVSDTSTDVPRLVSNAAPTVQPAGAAVETKKVGELRMLVLPKPTESVETASKPQIFRDDYGRVISERQWKMLQDRKEKAKEGGYVLDDYSQ